MYCVILPVCFLISLHLSNAELEKEISFIYYTDTDTPTHHGLGIAKDFLNQTKCQASDKFSFILHGWRTTCEAEWIRMLRPELQRYRKGCIVCIDYAGPASRLYGTLFNQFDDLVKIMTKKIKDLVDQGMDLSNAYMFGFSFGGQLALAIGKNFKAPKFREMDICDAAGVLFDERNTTVDHRHAADNVQCIHTSRLYGTSIYACHQNWRMGNCGHAQPLPCMTRSHSLCPLFYISAFENIFYAIKTPGICYSKNPAKKWPNGFKMGYNEKRKSTVNGELFAETSCDYPYNGVPRRRSTNLFARKQLYDSAKKISFLTVCSFLSAQIII